MNGEKGSVEVLILFAVGIAAMAAYSYYIN